jgi:hypothetical protein
MPTLKDALMLSGDLFLPKSVRTVLERYWVGNDKSLVYITNWSLIHLLSGVVTGWVLLTYFPKYDYYWSGFWFHTVWEVWQIVVSNTPWWTLRGRIDVVTDTVMFMLGMYLLKTNSILLRN